MTQYFTNFDEYPVGDITTSGQNNWIVNNNIETLVKFWIFKSGSDGSKGRFCSYVRYY